MKRTDVYEAIDTIRTHNYMGQNKVMDRICNYIEANIDEFIECYQEVEE